jgi:hypothetical protein
MFVPAWVLLGVVAFVAWTVLLWIISTTGGQSLRGQDIGYGRAVLDSLHGLAAWAVRQTRAVLAA